MNYEEALARIENWTEGDGKVIATTIRDHLAGIDKEVLSWKTRYARAEGQVKRLNELLGEEGKDAEATVKGLKEKLTKAEADLEARTAERDTAIADREATRLSNAVRDLGIDGDAFNQFLNKGILDVKKIKVDGDKVLVDGKPIKEYAESQGKWMVNALYTKDDDESHQEDERQSDTSSKQRTPASIVPTGGTKAGSRKSDPIADVKSAIAGLGYKFPTGA